MTTAPQRPPLRIGLLTSSFPRGPADPAGRFVLQFAAALSARGHEVDVLAPRDPHRPLPVGWLPPGVRLHPVAYQWPPALERTFYRAGAPENLARDPLAWPGALAFPAALAVAGRRLDPGWDALVTHWAVPAGLVGARLRARRPHLAVLHSGDVHLLERLPGGATLGRAVAAGASRLLFTHEELCDRFLRRIGARHARRTRHRCHVSPMGIDPVPPASGGREGARIRLGLPPRGEPRIALFVGRIVPIKGLDVVVRAAAGTGRKLLLALAGEGPERAPLRRLARRLGSPVRFLGHVDGARKADWLAAADVLLVPSRTLPDGRCEGVPHALLEALSAGLPVLASASGGLRSLHGCPAVRLLPEGDVARWRCAMLEWPPAHAREALAEAARRHAAPLHWDALAPRLEALLR